jgi:alkaline phosphatase D
LRKKLIITVSVAVVAAAAIGGGVLIGRATRSGSGGTGAAPGASAASFAVDAQYEGRVLLSSSVCTGDGRFTGFFRWTVAPGTNTQPYQVLVTPWEDDPKLATRTNATAQAKIGGLIPGREYAVTVYKPKSTTDVWARSTLTPPPCDDYQDACPPDADLMRMGPVTGATTDTTARVWIRTCHGAAMTVDYKPATAQWGDAKHKPIGDVDAAHDYTLVTTIDGLEPSTRYDYRIMVEGLLPDQPEAHFWTKPQPGTPAKFRFLSASDLHQLNSETRPGLADTLVHMQKADAQFELLLGDQLSVDDFGPFHPTATEAYLRHYRDNWSYRPFRSLLASTSTVMMWDDHDIINDWDSKSAPPYAFAKEAFTDFVGRQNPPPVRPNGTYFTFDAGDVSFFVLDVRSFRDKKHAPDSAAKTMLGPEQKAELKTWLTTSKAKFKFVTSGVEFHDHQTVPLKQDDAWEGFKTEREEIFNFIHNNHVSGVILISGDAHWPGVFKHEYGIPEFQTTPAGVTPPNPPPSAIGAPDVLFEDGLKNVFGQFDVDTTVSPARVDFTMVQSKGTELYKLTLTETDLAQ